MATFAKAIEILKFKEELKMRKQGSKILAALLVASMTLSMAACGQDEVNSKVTESESKVAESTESATEPVQEDLYYNKEGLRICDDKITITVTGRASSNTPDWSKTAMIQYIEDEMGIAMDITTHASDVWKTQLALMQAEDNMPDLTVNGSWDKAQSNQAGMDGYLLDLSQYLDIMPNFAAYLEANPDYKAYNTAPNGAIYGLAGVSETRSSKNYGGIYVSLADMEKYGFTAEDISTTEGFYNVLKKIKETDPDRIPLCCTVDSSVAKAANHVLKAAFGVYVMADNYMLGFDENGKALCYETTDNYKAYINYMNRLYEEKLLDNDCFIMTKDELKTKIKAGTPVFFSSADALMATLGAKDNTIVRDYYNLIAMKSDLVDEATVMYSSLVSNGTELWVSADTEYPEAICRLIDYCFFTYEGYLLTSFGVEGVSYVLEDDGFGNMVPNDSALFDAEKSGYENKSKWKWGANVVSGFATTFKRHPRDKFIETCSIEELDNVINGDVLSYISYAHNEKAVREQSDRCVFVSPGLVYLDTEKDKQASLMTDIQTYVKTMKPQFIRGEVDIDAEWNNYVAKINSIGLEELLSIEQAAYDRWVTNIK